MFLSVFSSRFASAQGEREVESLSRTRAVPESDKVEFRWGRDPFVPIVDTGGPPGLQLKAVFFNKQRPSAIIGEKILYRGDSIDDLKVIDIGKDYVILRGEGADLRLTLEGS